MGLPKPYYEDGQVTIYHGNCRMLAVLLGRAAFDLIVADPCFEQTSYDWDRWTAGWPGALLPLLSPRGSMWTFGTFRMFWERRDEFDDYRVAQDIIYEKHNGAGFNADRFRKVHEQPVQFYPRHSSWEQVYKSPIYTPGARARVIRRKASQTHTGARGACRYETEEGGLLLMRSVIRARSCHRRALNPTEKPMPIIAPIVEYSCPPAGRLLEPFMGSGAALLYAKLTGRRGVGIDVRESECEKAARRLSGILPSMLPASSVMQVQDLDEAA